MKTIAFDRVETGCVVIVCVPNDVGRTTVTRIYKTYLSEGMTTNPPEIMVEGGSDVC